MLLDVYSHSRTNHSRNRVFDQAAATYIGNRVGENLREVYSHQLNGESNVAKR